MFRNMVDKDALAFKKAWFMKRSFEFTTVRRKIITSHETSSCENGRWVSEMQLEMHFSAGVQNSEEGLRQKDSVVVLNLNEPTVRGCFLI